MPRLYEPELKAQVMAALLGGMTVSEASRRFGVARGTVGRWSSEIDKNLERTASTPACTEIAKADQTRLEATLERLVIAMAEAPMMVLEAIAQGRHKDFTAQDAELLKSLLGPAFECGDRLVARVAGIIQRQSPGEQDGLPEVAGDGGS